MYVNIYIYVYTVHLFADGPTSAFNPPACSECNVVYFSMLRNVLEAC